MSSSEKGSLAFEGQLDRYHARHTSSGIGLGPSGK